MTTPNNRVKRSEKLLPDEKKAFDRKVDSFDTKRDAAEYFGFSTVTLDNILLRGSCKPNTKKLILQKLGLAA